MVLRCTAVVLLVALLFPAVSIRADERYIRCESGTFGRYKKCSVDTDGRVQLVREFSNRKCTQWQSWGYDRSGVWVDKGCKAEFRVGKEGGIGAGGVAVIGAVAGAAIIGAILAGKHKGPDATEGAVAVPAWVQGRFHGFSPKTNTDIELTIAKTGAVSGTINGSDLTGYLAKDNRLHLGEVAFTLKREEWGFAATQVNDAENIVYFRRQ